MARSLLSDDLGGRDAVPAKVAQRVTALAAQWIAHGFTEETVRQWSDLTPAGAAYLASRGVEPGVLDKTIILGGSSGPTTLRKAIATGQFDAEEAYDVLVSAGRVSTDSRPAPRSAPTTAPASAAAAAPAPTSAPVQASAGKPAQPSAGNPVQASAGNPVQASAGNPAQEPACSAPFIPVPPEPPVPAGGPPRRGPAPAVFSHAATDEPGNGEPDEDRAERRRASSPPPRSPFRP